MIGLPLLAGWALWHAFGPEYYDEQIAALRSPTGAWEARVVRHVSSVGFGLSTAMTDVELIPSAHAGRRIKVLQVDTTDIPPPTIEWATPTNLRIILQDLPSGRLLTDQADVTNVNLQLMREAGAAGPEKAEDANLK